MDCFGLVKEEDERSIERRDFLSRSRCERKGRRNASRERRCWVWWLLLLSIRDEDGEAGRVDDSESMLALRLGMLFVESRLERLDRGGERSS